MLLVYDAGTVSIRIDHKTNSIIIYIWGIRIVLIDIFDIAIYVVVWQIYKTQKNQNVMVHAIKCDRVTNAYDRF